MFFIYILQILLFIILFFIIYLTEYKINQFLEDDSYIIKKSGYNIHKIVLYITNNIIKYTNYIDIITNNEANNTLKKLNKKYIDYLQICFLGDSEFTFWYNIENDLKNVKFNCFNSAFNNCRSIDIINYLDKLCIEFLPTLVILHIGNNDYDYNINKTIDELVIHILSNIKYIKYKLEKENIDLFILLSEIKPNYTQQKIEFFELLNNIIIKHFNIIDLRNLKFDLNDYRVDKTHLNKNGYKKKGLYLTNILNNEILDY